MIGEVLWMSFHQQRVNVVALNSLLFLSPGNSHCMHVINIRIEEVKWPLIRC